MKSSLGSRSRLVALAGAVCVFSLASTSLSAATVSTGFEPGTNGTYTVTGDVVGKQDTSLGGTWSGISGWGNPAGVIISSPNGQSGSTSLRIADTSASAYGAQIQASNLDSSLLGSPFTFSLAMNVRSIDTPTSGQQVQVQLGASTFGTGSNWLKFGYDGSIYSKPQSFFLVTKTTTSKIELKDVCTTAAYGEWVVFNITIDPNAHTITSATLTGSKGTVDFGVSGQEILWDGANIPSNYLTMVTGSDDIVTVDFDNLSVTSAVPEPATLGLLGGGLLLLASLRRKNRRD